MLKTESKLTVFFDDPFWVGVYERVSEGELEVCKITFGTEPKDCEIYEFILCNFNKFVFSPPVKAEEKRETQISPKRMQREINKQLDAQGIGTKSQQALKLQQEQAKTARKEKSKLKTEEEKQLKYILHQQKQKEKHRGHCPAPPKTDIARKPPIVG